MYFASMKRWMGALALCLLVLLLACASAQTYTISDPENRRDYYVCEDFAGGMPDYAREVFAPLLREGDEIVCGTIALEYLTGEEDLWRAEAMTAIRREGRLLLLGASKFSQDRTWEVCVESDSFLPEDRPFTITTLADYNTQNSLRSADLAIVCGKETLRIRTFASGALYLWRYERDEADGSKRVIACDSRYFAYTHREDGKILEEHSASGPLPVRLWAWTYDSFPRTVSQLEAWTAEHVYPLAEDEGYAAGVNLRERPTGKSKSYGVYSAKVQILGQQPGIDAPWYNVRVGNLTGWVSGVYLRTAQENPTYLAASKTGTSQVGRAERDVALRDLPGGAQIMTIPAGTLVHVLMNNDGYLHVIVPRNELTWETDWDGTYGFVKSGEMTVGDSLADVIWR